MSVIFCLLGTPIFLQLFDLIQNPILNILRITVDLCYCFLKLQTVKAMLAFCYVVFAHVDLSSIYKNKTWESHFWMIIILHMTFRIKNIKTIKGADYVPPSSYTNSAYTLPFLCVCYSSSNTSNIINSLSCCPLLWPRAHATLRNVLIRVMLKQFVGRMFFLCFILPYLLVCYEFIHFYDVSSECYSCCKNC